MLKLNFAQQVFEKFKSKFFFLQAEYSDKIINELALKLKLEKYNREIPKDKIENI